MDLVIFIGLPGSGKSTFFRHRFAETHALISKDLLRASRRPGQRQQREIEKLLAAGRSVVVDNTHPSRADRSALVELGRRFGARVVGYHFQASVADCLARNRGRQGRARVPDVAIFVIAKRMQSPTRDEGYDELYDVRVSGDRDFNVVPAAPAPPAT